MKFVVLIKEVPDTYGERHLDPATGRLDRASGEQVLDEISERAVEIALQVKDRAKDAEVVVLTMGPSSATGALRKSLAMGADRALHVVDSALDGADALLTARVLAAAIRREGFDLVVTGNASSDGATGVIPGMLAELLGVPIVGAVAEVAIDDGGVRGTRDDDGASLRLHAPLPAVLSITEKAAEARFPGFKGILGAKKKPLETISLSGLAIEGLASMTRVESTAPRPPKTVGERIVDDPAAAQRIVDFLDARGLVTKGA